MENLDENKPRKLEDDTAQYLKQIEEQFDNLNSNQRGVIDDDTIEQRNILIENVLLELSSRNRTASAISDRRSNFLMERICLQCDLNHLLTVIDSCSIYSLFLARNRYSSHVIQAIMARLCYIL